MSTYTCKDHFLTCVAHNAVSKTYGPQAKSWPEHHFWQVVSSVKATIREDQVPILMKRYKINSLPGYTPEDITNA